MMSYSTEDRVSLYSIIGAVCGNLGIRNVNNVIDDFARWAVEGELKIGSEGSYKRYECEIDVQNRKACLPRNFVTLLSLKHGNEILDMTRRDFRLFDKAGGNANFDPNAPTNNRNGQRVINDPGQALSIQVTFGGVFVAGETVVLTIVHNNCGAIQSNTYTYVVQIGDTPALVAAAFANQIQAISGLGYMAVAVGVELTITGVDTEITFTVTPYTDSINGTIDQCIIQQHRPTINRTIDLNTGKHIPKTTSENLADLHAYELNTGNQATSGATAGSINGNGGYFFNYGPNSSKFSIENGYIYFNVANDTRLGIAYWGVWLDDEGWPLIKASHEDAVAHYLMYMYKSREFYAGKLPQYVHQELKTRWIWLCGQARGDDEMPNEAELRYLNNMWAQLLPLPNKNFF
jgi:hypothetical protein